MPVDPSLIEFVRRQGRERRRLTRVERMRSELSRIVDTAALDDDDVKTLHAAWSAGRDEPQEDR